ncbi:DNA cytosine methyltransferase [Glutamicibacter ardleyensis]|uniref:DNA cytosine methyltransferase n=1 Tax=Glutamicibacter ardleyensis TaxID=225894 RepID=UPI003FD0C30B
MIKLKLGELFAGFGGLGMAVEEVFDAELAWYAEFDDAPSKIMAHHWPGVPNHRDVTAVDWSQVEPVDIISGGSPCQDLSAAGRRAGMTEGTRSNLWVSMREAIATIKPTYVVWENVRGAYSAKATSASDLEPGDGSVGVGAGDNLRALGRVLGDLADLGYDCQWRGLRAADVGAPHGRYRVFILATRRGAIANPDSIRSKWRDDAPRPLQSGKQDLASRVANGGTSEPRAASANADDERGDGGGERGDGGGERGDGGGERTKQDWRGEPADSGHVTADTAGGRRERPRQTASRQAEGIWPSSSAGVSGRTPTGANWGVYAPAIRRWETLRGTAPAPTELTTKGKHRLASRFAEWMMGLRRGHVTDVPGLTRNEELKALGNGVVPQQAIAALKNMLEANK